MNLSDMGRMQTALVVFEPRYESINGFREMENAVECIACRSELKRGASVCPVCKANQSPFRNAITFFAGAVSLIALVASAITYVTSGALGVWKEYAWKDDVELVYFASTENSLIANTGSGDVFVSQVEVYFGESSTNYLINRNIEKGKLVSAETKDANLGPTWGILATAPGKAISPAEYLRNAKSDCAKSVFMSEGYPSLERMKEFYKAQNLVMSDATATANIVFVSGNRGSVIHKRFPVHWLLEVNKVPGC